MVVIAKGAFDLRSKCRGMGLCCRIDHELSKKDHVDTEDECPHTYWIFIETLLAASLMFDGLSPKLASNRFEITIPPTKHSTSARRRQRPFSCVFKRS